MLITLPGVCLSGSPLTDLSDKENNGEDQASESIFSSSWPLTGFNGLEEMNPVVLCLALLCYSLINNGVTREYGCYVDYA